MIMKKPLVKKPPKITKTIAFAVPGIGKEEIKAVTRVLKSRWLTMGPEVIKFEKEFAKTYGIKNAIAVNSATSGLHLALLAGGIGPGDEVILPSYTFVSCANTIVWVGAKPVFAESTEDFLIDPEDVKKKITKKTKAIMVVHFGGQMAEMKEIQKIAQKHKLKIIEDCAHSLLAKYYGKLAGTFGDIGVFSFYAIKNLTTGEGGMVITADDKLADRVLTFRLHGMSLTAFDRYSRRGKWYYEITEAGFKYNLTDMAAAMGIEQLKKIKKFNARRAQIATLYQKNLAGVPKIRLPRVLPGRTHVWHLFPIQVAPERRDQIIKDLREFNICTSVHFIPLHLQHYYQKKFKFPKNHLPMAERVYQGEISLPMYPDLKNSEVKYICRVLKYLVENPK